MDDFRLDAQVAMVSGCHQGLGQAIAIALAEVGANVVAIDRSEPNETRAIVESLGRRFEWLQMDLSQPTPAELQVGVDETLQKLGRLDILVNNAGTTRRGPALTFSEADWDVVIQTNLKSVFFLSQAVGRHFVKQRRGKVINIASILSQQGGILVAAYTAAKHGMWGLTQLLSNEWAPHGVNVNAIAPGYTRTTMTTPLQNDPERNAALLDRIPLGRWGAPRDIAGAAVFLASAASNYVCGAMLNVDGGWMAR